MFGRRDSRQTQRALRYFKERRVEVSLVDVAVRPPAPTELRRFIGRFGASAMLDTSSRLYRGQGLAYLRMDEAEMADRLLAEPRLLRLPLVRMGEQASVGVDEQAWRRWLLEDGGRLGAAAPSRP
ncbi:MAG: arsenate reductase [Chloroflexi bacterium]|nr:arsenate reductase [Chloroflexota bacterium]